jgi:hypothetical protein
MAEIDRRGEEEEEEEEEERSESLNKILFPDSRSATIDSMGIQRNVVCY